MNYIENKSYKGTPQKIIDFSSYLSNCHKKNIANSVSMAIKKAEKKKKNKKITLNSRNITHIVSKQEVSESNSCFKLSKKNK